MLDEEEFNVSQVLGSLQHSPSYYYFNRVTKRRAKELQTDPSHPLKPGFGTKVNIVYM